MEQKQKLLERLKYVVKRLDDAIEQFDQKPIPYDFYRAIKNEGEDSGWSYECVGIGISDLEEIIEELEK